MGAFEDDGKTGIEMREEDSAEGARVDGVGEGGGN